MQVVRPEAFVQKFDGGEKNIDCISVSGVYTDGGYTQNSKVDVAQKSESSISIRVSKRGSSIIQGIPIIDPKVVCDERTKKKYQKVNIGAIVVSIHKYGYYDKETCKGKCMLVDGRRNDENGVINSFWFDVSKGPAHFVIAPNVVFDINDELLDKACELYFSFESVKYREGSRPFAVEIGTIYRMSNAFNCYHKLGVPGRRGNLGSSFQEIHGTSTLQSRDVHKAIEEMVEAKREGRVGEVGIESSLELSQGARKKIMPWKKRGPSFYREYSVDCDFLEKFDEGCNLRSSTSNIDERRVFENILGCEISSTLQPSNTQSDFRENGRSRSSSESSLAQLDRRCNWVPGRSLWSENEEAKKEDTSEGLLGKPHESRISESGSCKRASEFHGC
ncbi:movement protein [Ocimum basilicum RNA virus 1]|uniref:movement protein n=1 Tax=Ocimum basilicum RNA virus 1 TaxID=2020286 RepID=UPI000B5E9788|nr:movement protein [Ocimum basilicum RNA virus 1]ASL68497.1 movement protein [Ocimum basilicum RNA virus 1]